MKRETPINPLQVSTEGRLTEEVNLDTKYQREVGSETLLPSN